MADRRAEEIRRQFVAETVDVRPCIARLREHAVLLYHLTRKAPGEWTAEDVRAVEDALADAQERLEHVAEVVRGEAIQVDGAP